MRKFWEHTVGEKRSSISSNVKRVEKELNSTFSQWTVARYVRGMKEEHGIDCPW